MSHSARSAWIETRDDEGNGVISWGRTPQGVRGLKPGDLVAGGVQRQSHSARSAWIETEGLTVSDIVNGVALRKECVD